MSLSQKHVGKILVPWFNVAEWKHVYKLIYFEPYRNWPKAVDVLKIWKTRTPLLSAGVEGTLILLQALLSDQNKLTDYEFTHIYSTALIRFLNLCAANSSKQGTFYKTAIENDLPHWLISIRHEIAHSHKLPAKSMLILCIKYCLDWLKSKYWEVQFNRINDLVVEKTRPELFEEAVFVYIQLIQSEINEDWHLDEAEDLFNDYVDKITINQPKIRNNRTKLLRIVCDIIGQGVGVEPDWGLNIINKQLIDSHVLFTVNWKKNVKQLPEDFVRAWLDVLTIIYNNGVLEDFLLKLLNVTLNENCDENVREIASFWIATIFVQLSLVKNKENSFIFDTKNGSVVISNNFLNEAVAKVSPYSINFIQEVLEYYQAPKDFIEDHLELSKAFLTSEKPSSNTVFTINDLDFEFDNVSSKQIDGEITEPPTQWRRVKDVSIYKNLPLGILPHQLRTKNPTLDI